MEADEVKAGTQTDLSTEFGPAVGSRPAVAAQPHRIV
jgi:hypothetical protein